MKSWSKIFRTLGRMPWTDRLRLPTGRNLAITIAAAALAVGALILSILMPSAASTPNDIGAASTADANGALQLHVAGNELVNASGQRVVLHGVDRSGTEFMCVQDRGIFDGPSAAASIRVMKQHGINAVRVPLNEACWNGQSYVKPAYAGAKYRAAVTRYVSNLNANGVVAILDLHWTEGQYTGGASACPSAQATCQKPMPDAAGAVPFWRSVAGTFKGNDAVIFDLFNEPYPEQANHTNETAGWRCWLHGGSACAGINYDAAGMQTLVDAVRSTGANNVLMLGGIWWSNDLSHWLQYEPVDPDHNLAASWHSYNFNTCSTKTCWKHEIAPVIAKVPVIAGEIGENDCAGTYVNRLTSWMDAHSASYLAWTWNSDFNCATGPGLITNYNGQPTKFGAAYEAHLQDATQTASQPRS
jgi:endoglucanase